LDTFNQTQIIPLIESLIQFIGIGRFKNAVAGWRNACSKSRKLTKRYHFEQSFHWWRALDEYWEATSPKRKRPAPLTTHIVALAKDTQVVQTVVATMPGPLKARFATALGSRENAPAALFEISVAHQFLKLGYSLTWCEDDGTPMPEFIAMKGSLSFEVECKQISFDTGRHIARADFCQLADQLEPKLRKLQFMGRVEITLNDRLSGKPQDREQIANDIAKAAGAGASGEINFAWGSAVMQLQPHDQRAIDFPALELAERESKPLHAQMLVTADNLDGPAANPLTISAQSRHADDVLTAAYSTLSVAARRQLSGARPGVLCLFLPEITDYESLKDAPAFRKLVDDLFDSNSRSHVAAVVFSSHDRVQKLPDGMYFDKPVLAYRNGQCCFPEAAAAFRYLTEAEDPAST
jgi:hypothetical protein